MYSDDFDEEPMSLKEWEDSLLELVKEGLVVVSPRPGGGQPTFYPVEMATDEMWEFTKDWLKFPHFDIKD